MAKSFRLLTILVIILASFLSNICFAKEYYAIVKKVLDGDTVELITGEHLRYIGIDAPETHIKKNDQWIESEEPCAKLAEKRNRELVEGKKVKIVFDKERRDKYGRLLGYVFLDNTLVNELLVAEGLAFPYIISPNTYYKDRIHKAFLKGFLNKKNIFTAQLKHNELSYMIGKKGWFSGKIRNIFFGNKKAEIWTDYLTILTNKTALKKRKIGIGNNIYAYGTLHRRKERYVMLIEKPSHLYIE